MIKIGYWKIKARIEPLRYLFLLLDLKCEEEYYKEFEVILNDCIKR